MSRPRSWSWLVWLWVIYVGMASGVSVAVTDDLPVVLVAVVVLVALVLAVSGALVVWKRPANRIGWLLLVASAYIPVSGSLRLLRGVLVGDAVLWAAWGEQVSFWVCMGPLLVFVPLLFPDGRLPSLRWRWAAWAGVVAVAAIVVGNAVEPGLLAGEELSNPLTFRGAGTVAATSMTVGFVTFPAVLGAAITSVAVRFRRSRGIERLQMRWLMVGVCGAVTSWALAIGWQLYTGDMESGGWIFGAGLLLIPIAVTVAVLRYRLYDIDRLISRTLAYGSLTVLLAAVYAAGVVVLGSVGRALTGDGGGDLVVAGSTLLVAALFQPLRRRVQTMVGRYFNRVGYDATRTVEDFASRLRDDVDLELLADDLTRVTGMVLQPARVGVWLSPGPNDAIETQRIGLTAMKPRDTSAAAMNQRRP